MVFLKLQSRNRNLAGTHFLFQVISTRLDLQNPQSRPQFTLCVTLTG